MCITSETCRAKSVIKKLELNNLHQAGPSKPTLPWCLVAETEEVHENLNQEC